MTLASVQQLAYGERARDPAWRDPRKDIGRAGQKFAQRNVSRFLSRFGPDQISLVEVPVHRLDCSFAMEPANALRGEVNAFAIQVDELVNDLLMRAAFE
jgi:hypothetical protein